MKTRDRLWLELLIPGLTIVYGVLYALDTRGLAEQSVFFPRALMAVMLPLVLLVLFHEYRNRQGTAADEGVRGQQSLRNPAIVIGTSLLYLGLFALLGYVPATAIFIVGFLLLYGTGWWRSLVIGIGFTAGLWLVFAGIFGVRI